MRSILSPGCPPLVVGLVLDPLHLQASTAVQDPLSLGQAQLDSVVVCDLDERQVALLVGPGAHAGGVSLPLHRREEQSGHRLGVLIARLEQNPQRLQSLLLQVVFLVEGVLLHFVEGLCILEPLGQQ